MTDKLRSAMLISGGGTTMAAIIRATKSSVRLEPAFLKRVEPVLVIASKPDAGGIPKALDLGMARENIVYLKPPKKGEPNEAFGEAILAECRKRSVDFIGQYGWLPKTPVNVIEAYKGMITNQHPGPLDPGYPDFGGIGMYGRRVHCARLYFVRETARRQCRELDYYQHHFTEAVCQLVAPEFDKGELLMRMTVPIEPDDTVDELQQRVLVAEHTVQIETLEAFSEGRQHPRPRESRLVRKEDLYILTKAKHIAGILYPHG